MTISSITSQLASPSNHIMCSVSIYSAMGYLSPLGLEWGVLNGAMSSISRIAVEKCAAFACKRAKLDTEEKIRLAAVALHIIISVGSIYASLAIFDHSLSAWSIIKMAFLTDLPMIAPFMEQHARALPQRMTPEYLDRKRREA